MTSYDWLIRSQMLPCNSCAKIVLPDHTFRKQHFHTSTFSYFYIFILYLFAYFHLLSLFHFSKKLPLCKSSMCTSLCLRRTLLHMQRLCSMIGQQLMIPWWMSLWRGYVHFPGKARETTSEFYRNFLHSLKISRDRLPFLLIWWKASCVHSLVLYTYSRISA